MLLSEYLEEKVLDSDVIENDRRLILQIIHNLQDLLEALEEHVRLKKWIKFKKFARVVEKIINIICDPDPSNSEIFELYYTLEIYPSPKVKIMLTIPNEIQNRAFLMQSRRKMLKAWYKLRARYPLAILKAEANDTWSNYITEKEGSETVMI